MGAVSPPPKYLCNYGPPQVKGPLWEKNGHFVYRAPTGIGVPRVKGSKKVAPSKGPLQIKDPYTDKGLHTRAPCRQKTLIDDV